MDGLLSVSSSTAQSPTFPSPTSMTLQRCGAAQTSSVLCVGLWCWWSRWPSPSSCPDAKLLLAPSSSPLSCLRLSQRQDNSFGHVPNNIGQLPNRRSNSMSQHSFRHLNILQCILSMNNGILRCGHWLYADMYDPTET